MSLAAVWVMAAMRRRRELILRPQLKWTLQLQGTNCPGRMLPGAERAILDQSDERDGPGGCRARLMC